MNFVEFTAGPDDDGRRFDRVVKKILSLQTSGPEQSVFALLRKGFIKLNGKKADGNARVQEKDIISFAEFLISSVKSPQNNTPSVHLDTIFRNEYIWIINKPYGIPVQPSPSDSICLSRIVEAEYAESKTEKSLSFTPGPLHRLDRNTTGLLAFSQNLEGAQWFTKAVSSEKSIDSTNGKTEGTDPRLITKTYVGLVQGTLDYEELWEDYIDQTPKENDAAGSFKTVRVIEGTSSVNAVTRAIPLAYGSHNGNKLTLVQFTLITGRKHQIRACSSFHHHPLYGDKAYGGKKMIIPGENIEYFLHAIRLDFCGDRPLSLQKDTFNGDRPLGLPEFLEAPLPKEFSTFLTQNLINWNRRLIIK